MYFYVRRQCCYLSYLQLWVKLELRTESCGIVSTIWWFAFSAFLLQTSVEDVPVPLKQNSRIVFGSADAVEEYECFWIHLLAAGPHPSVTLKSCFHSTSQTVLALE